MTPMASTPKYIKLAGLPSFPIMPTAPFTHTRRNAVAYAILQRIDDNELEDFILAKHLNLSDDFKTAQKEHQKSQTISARELLEQMENE